MPQRLIDFANRSTAGNVQLLITPDASQKSSIGGAFRALLAWKAHRCLSLLVAFILAVPSVHAQRADAPPLPELPSASSEKKLVTAKHFMVAAAHPLASEAGMKILERGGSATDAAIAVQMVLGLVEPQSSGIGGGAFILHFDAAKKVVGTFDGRESAPMGVTPELFLDANGKPLRFIEAVVGGRSVGVPGVLRALEVAHARHGKLPWATLFEPAITLAESGYPLPPRLHVHLVNDTVLKKNPVTREMFFLADGSPKAIGSIIRNQPYADTLKRIAKQGADAFYTGEIAKDMVAAIRGHPTNPGYMVEKDLADYRARTPDPVCGPYRKYRICGMPPPSSGGIAILQTLQALERFDMKSVRPISAQAVHLLSEAARLAYADRERYLGDDQFVSIPLAGLADATYNHRRSELIRPEKSMGRAEAGVPAGITANVTEGWALERPGTSHLSIVDRWGNAISMTTSVESVFGSRIFVHGFFLNNQLTDFSMLPTRDGVPVANAVYPGKRPRSSMAPTIVLDDKGELHSVIGSALGSVIINFVAQTLVATLDWNMDMQAAVSLPHYGSRGGPTELEKGTPVEALGPALQAMGHEVRSFDMPSGLHGIMRTPQGWQGGADPRRDGIVLGK